jgi:hypothetical protein
MLHFANGNLLSLMRATVPMIGRSSAHGNSNTTISRELQEGNMETAWIQVFVLTLTQCIAPAGKMVCQEETVEYHFTNENDCASALVQLVELAAVVDNVIVDRERSSCRPAAKESVVYAQADDVKGSLDNAEDFVLIDGETPAPDFTQSEHAERLANTRTCEETDGVAPCKIGEIILEGTSDSTRSDVWIRQK